MARNWQALYDLQDWALRRLGAVDHGFYLTGGTALARGYYQHRYSEDLDFFVNDVPEFELWRDRCFKTLMEASAQSGFHLDIVLREDRFGRAVLHASVPLKLEFINDVPFRVGHPWNHPLLGRLDTKENILSNKISALVDRMAPKDLVDIYWLCCRDNLDLVQAIQNAEGKAAGIFPPVVASALQDALAQGLPQVFWQEVPSESHFKTSIELLINKIMEG